MTQYLSYADAGHTQISGVNQLMQLRQDHKKSPSGVLRGPPLGILRDKQIRTLALDCTKYQNELRDKTGKIRNWQDRFVEEFNGRKQESAPQKATKQKHALLHEVQQAKCNINLQK